MHNLTVMNSAVRLYIEHNQTYFNFREYGGKDKAIEAAKKKRDSYPSRVIHSHFDHDRIKSYGEVPHRGILLYVHKSGEWVGYQCQWQEGEPKKGRRRQRRKCFHFKKYDDPLDAALKYRAEMLRLNGLEAAS